MIKNIISDIGDVLVKSDWRNFFGNKGFDEGVSERLAKASFFSPVWKELDRGTLCFEKVVEGFVQNDPELETPICEAFADLHGFISKYPYSEEWIGRLKKDGMNVYCLSNISDKICNDCKDELDFLSLVDGRVLSYEEKLIKPDKAIFMRILEKYGLSAGESVFIDDLEENVKAARSLGFYGIVFKSREQAEKDIERIRKEQRK